MLSRDPGPRAVLNALDRLADTYEAQGATARKDLAIAEGQLRDYQARLGREFTHEAYLTELTALRDQLKAGLSDAKPEPGVDPAPPVAELAERIKALRAAHTIEAPPQRTTPRAARARRGAGHRPHPPPDRAAHALPAEAVAEAEQPLKRRRAPPASAHRRPPRLRPSRSSRRRLPPHRPHPLPPGPRPSTATASAAIQRQPERQMSLF